VIVKASAGGGGRGMRVVEKMEDLEKSFLAAESEALSAFGDGTLYMEKYINGKRSCYKVSWTVITFLIDIFFANFLVFLKGRIFKI
jgi:carbamoylphosphate synthase large subunit